MSYKVEIAWIGFCTFVTTLVMNRGVTTQDFIVNWIFTWILAEVITVLLVAGLNRIRGYNFG